MDSRAVRRAGEVSGVRWWGRLWVAEASSSFSTGCQLLLLVDVRRTACGPVHGGRLPADLCAVAPASGSRPKVVARQPIAHRLPRAFPPSASVG